MNVLVPVQQFTSVKQKEMSRHWNDHKNPNKDSENL